MELREQFTRRRIRFLLDLSAIKGFGAVAGLVAPVLILRYLGAELTGQLQFASAMLLLPTVLYSNIPGGVVRFGSTSAPGERAEIFGVHLMFGGAIVAAILLLGIPFLLHRPDLLLGTLAGRFDGLQQALITCFFVATLPIALLADLMSAHTSSAGRVKDGQLLLTLRPLVAIGGILALMVLVEDRTWGLVGVVASRLTAQAATSMAFAFSRRGCAGLLQQLGELPAGRLRQASKLHWRRFRTYTVPLQVASSSAYVKDNLAVLILGKLGLLQELAYFDVLKRIFDVPRKLAPGFLNNVMPIMLRKLADGREKFKADFRQLSWLQFLLMGAVGTAFILGHKPLAAALAAQGVPEFRLLVLLFAINLLINSQGQSNAYLMSLGEDTRVYMWTTLVRLTVVTTLTFLLVPRYGSVGGALALILSTVAVGFLTSIETRRQGLVDFASSVKQAATACLICGVWAACMAIFKG